MADKFGHRSQTSHHIAASSSGQGPTITSLLQQATEIDGCDRAWIDRALWALLPSSSITNAPTIDVPLARHAVERAVAASSNATAQFLAGFLYAADLNSTAAVDQSRALLQYTFAAYQGLAEAEMTLGYRHWAGISVKEDCLDALDWYESAAEKSYAHFLAGPPGGRTLPLTALKLTDAIGGIYGPGASWASTGPNAQRAAIRASQQLGETDNGLEDVLEWYRYQSDREDAWKTVYLGKVFYTGSAYSIAGGLASGAEGVGAVDRDFAKARGYFLQIARALWPRDPALPVADDFGAKAGRRESAVDQLSGPAALAATYLGRMYLRGEGVAQDFAAARMWLKRGSDMGLAEAHNMLGIMWRDGLGVKVVPSKAMHYFKAAAGMELAEAKINLGKMQLDQPGVSMALFTQAIQSGNNYEAYFYLAKMHARDARAKPERGVCGAAVAFFKNVAERGRWQYDYLGDAERAWQRGDRERALVNWWIASEMGYEVAQNNVAYLLEQRDLKDSALTHWIRSAGQQNVDAVVRVGDYAYQGLLGEDRYEQAAGWYQSAADTQASAIAFWNLGWMYENGLGVAQDFHLAKRYYDLCRETDSEADLPALLSLVKLHVRSWWARFLGGKQEALTWGDDETSGDESRRSRPSEDSSSSSDPSLDLVEWSRRRQSDELAGYDDYLETGRNARRHTELEFEFDEELADMIMIALIAAVAAIALYRAHRQRQRRDAPPPPPPAAAPELPFAPLP